MQPRRGRPSCNKICCQEDGEDVLTLAYTKHGMSVREIAQLLEVSDAHINKRLHFFGIITKTRGRYLGKSGRPRRSKLWGLSDQELFKTPVDELAYKYQMSHSGVEYARRKRRKKEVSKEANVKESSVLRIEKSILPIRK